MSVKKQRYWLAMTFVHPMPRSVNVFGGMTNVNNDTFTKCECNENGTIAYIGSMLACQL